MGTWKINPFTLTYDWYEGEPPFPAILFHPEIDITTLNFDSVSPVSMFDLLVNSIPELVRVIIVTPFNGTAPTLTVGVVGTLNKYVDTMYVDLKGAAKTVYEVTIGEGAIAGTLESVIATYVADGSSAGSARIEFHYAANTYGSLMI